MKQSSQRHSCSAADTPAPLRPPQPRQAEQTPLAVIMRPVASLIPDPRNARIHTAKHVAQIAASMSAFGFTVPILVDGQLHVIAGHGRLLAAQQLGWPDVPSVMLEHLSPDQVRAYRIADNRLTDCSTWDERLLAEQLNYLKQAELDFDIEAIGFEMPEIDLRIQSLGDLDDAPTAADIEPSSEPTVTQLGDIWQLGAHRILCGDALQAATYAALLGMHRVAMVFSDPPYNVPIAGHVGGNGRLHHTEFAMASGEMSVEDFTNFLDQVLRRMRAACVEGALMYVCMDWRHLIELTAAGHTNALDLKNLCVWDKGCGGMGSFYRSQHELVFVYKAGTAKHTNNVQLGRFGRNRTNVWNYPGINSFARNTGEGNLLALHPTVKPVALVADAILDACERGDRVLDPFLGSGTTVIAAQKTGRVAYGIELDPKYVDVSVRRWQRLTGLHATHAESGHSFDQTAQQRHTLPCADAAITPAVVEGARS
jgi:DNA modification methylase